MISKAEMKVNLRNTKAFIDADAETITLEPRAARAEDGAGGWVDVPGPTLPPITVRLIPVEAASGNISPVEGTRDDPKYTLMAMPDTDVSRYDRFKWRDDTWKIDRVHNKPEYELKADVVLDVG